MKLGKLHRYWLRQLSDVGGRMGVGYGPGPHMNALQGLIDRGYVRLAMEFESLGLVELTDAGREAAREAA